MKQQPPTTVKSWPSFTPMSRKKGDTFLHHPFPSTHPRSIRSQPYPSITSEDSKYGASDAERDEQKSPHEWSTQQHSQRPITNESPPKIYGELQPYPSVVDHSRSAEAQSKAIQPKVQDALADLDKPIFESMGKPSTSHRQHVPSSLSASSQSLMTQVDGQLNQGSSSTPQISDLEESLSNASGHTERSKVDETRLQSIGDGSNSSNLDTSVGTGESQVDGQLNQGLSSVHGHGTSYSANSTASSSSNSPQIGVSQEGQRSSVSDSSSSTQERPSLQQGSSSPQNSTPDLYQIVNSSTPEVDPQDDQSHDKPQDMPKICQELQEIDKSSKLNSQDQCHEKMKKIVKKLTLKRQKQYLVSDEILQKTDLYTTYQTLKNLKTKTSGMDDHDISSLNIFDETSTTDAPSSAQLDGPRNALNQARPFQKPKTTEPILCQILLSSKTTDYIKHLNKNTECKRRVIAGCITKLNELNINITNDKLQSYTDEHLKELYELLHREDVADKRSEIHTLLDLGLHISGVLDPHHAKKKSDPPTMNPQEPVKDSQGLATSVSPKMDGPLQSVNQHNAEGSDPPTMKPQESVSGQLNDVPAVQHTADLSQQDSQGPATSVSPEMDGQLQSVSQHDGNEGQTVYDDVSRSFYTASSNPTSQSLPSGQGDDEDSLHTARSNPRSQSLSREHSDATFTDDGGSPHTSKSRSSSQRDDQIRSITRDQRSEIPTSTKINHETCLDSINTLNNSKMETTIESEMKSYPDLGLYKKKIYNISFLENRTDEEMCALEDTLSKLSKKRGKPEDVINFTKTVEDNCSSSDIAEYCKENKKTHERETSCITKIRTELKNKMRLSCKTLQSHPRPTRTGVSHRKLST